MDVSTKGTELNQRLRGESGSWSSNGHPVLECLVQLWEILADDAIFRSGEDGKYSMQLYPPRAPSYTVRHHTLSLRDRADLNA
jgi:hypothetical protein